MTGFIVSVFPFRNRVSSKEAFEGLELGEGKPSRPVLRGPGGRKAAWLLGNCSGPDSRQSGLTNSVSFDNYHRIKPTSSRPAPTTLRKRTTAETSRGYPGNR